MTGAQRVHLARAIAFGVLALWIIGGPFYRQVLKQKASVVRKWTMFGGKRSVGIVDVEFYRKTDAGQFERIDRYEVLDRPRTRSSGGVYVMRSEGTTASVARKLCKRLGKGSELRAWSRIATKHGWRPLHRGRRNLCTKRGAP